MIYVYGFCGVLVIGTALLWVVERRREKQESKRWTEMWDRMRASTRRMYMEDEKAGFIPHRSLAEELDDLSQREAKAFLLRSR